MTRLWTGWITTQKIPARHTQVHAYVQA